MRLVVMADRPLIADALVTGLREVFDTSEVTRAGAEDSPRSLAGHGVSVAVVDLDRPASEQGVLCERMAAAGIAGLFLVGGPEEALQLLEAGAAGIVTFDQGLAGLVEAVRTAREGNTYVPAALLGGVLQGLIRERRRAGQPRGAQLLSAREREVLELLAAGRDVAEIANRLVISPETAKTHIRHILNKLGARSRVEAVALAVDAGLIPERSAR